MLGISLHAAVILKKQTAFAEPEFLCTAHMILRHRKKVCTPAKTLMAENLEQEVWKSCLSSYRQGEGKAGDL